ncbi:DUF1330 domain-containing protein [Phragmitibacter flavus]|uniref:DUF1330 domain-containing protein n=1 Tax=Phragmitibacter flavus TaxID=2576071 RepID=A0A5R8KKU6_9BACT|nr:DUF1330 domain-containing protein [Phragmitibacter flavus]
MSLTAGDTSEKEASTKALKTESAAEQPEQKVQAKKPAYVIFTREKTLDQAELETYWKMVGASLEGHPMKVLSGYGPHEVLEGDKTEGVVIAEFPSMEAAKAWYDSPAYRAAREHRFKGAVYRGILVEATPAPQ